MSPKDLASISFLDKLVDAGISILKIEGRGRPAEYVGTVTRVYKEALAAIKTGNYTENNIIRWQKEIGKVYNRGFWEGYYLGKKTGEWSERHGSSATTKKEYIGRISNFFNNISVVEAKAETGDVFPGEQIIITGPTTGLYEGKIEEIHIEHKSRKKADKGQLFAFKVSRLIRRGDKLYRIIKANR